MRLSSTAALCSLRGTVLSNLVLWIELLVVVIVLWGSCYLSEIFFARGAHDEATQSEVLEMASRMSTLAAFLFSFYTSLTVARWWRLRCDGVGNIWSASSQLSMFIAECVTRDERVLSSIRRYARASLAIRFLQRRYKGKLKEHLEELVHMDILTKEEVSMLSKYNNNLSESLWTWVTRIVMDLHKKGDIASDIILKFLLEKVALGRSGAGLIGAQMGTPIPMLYVHLLSWMVKVHNILVAACNGFILVQTGTGTITTARVFLIALLYNSLLLINAELADPFDDGGSCDFPLAKYEQGIESDGLGYVQAGEHVPSWMKKSE